MMELKEIATVGVGYPFRGAIPKSDDGEVMVVQMRDVEPDLPVKWGGLMRTHLAGKEKWSWLMSGDIIFLARGTRNFAVYIDEPPSEAKAACSPHFFKIDVKAGAAVLPEFLAWQLNRSPAREYFARSAEGSTIPSIRRPVLESVPVAVPSVDEQREIVKLHHILVRQSIVLENLLYQRRKLMDSVARDLTGRREKPSHAR